jgi:hypothetical protein
MLDRAMFELWGTHSEVDLVSRLLPLSDDQLIDEALREADEALHQAEGTAGKTRSLDAAISLLRKLRHRALFKELATFDHSNVQEPHIAHIKRDYAGLASPMKAAAGYRTQAARHLEFDFVLPPGSIAIYCAHVIPKIAEVSVDVDGDIMAFNKYEELHENRLSGGHLQAQIRRFEHLWRLYFFIDDEAKKLLSDERLRHLQGFIRDVVLCYDRPEELVRRVKDEAVLYVHLNKGIELVSEPITFARGDPPVPQRDFYPNGAPVLQPFIRQQQVHREEG